MVYGIMIFVEWHTVFKEINGMQDMWELVVVVFVVVVVVAAAAEVVLKQIYRSTWATAAGW